MEFNIYTPNTRKVMSWNEGRCNFPLTKILKKTMTKKGIRMISTPPVTETRKERHKHSLAEENKTTRKQNNEENK